MLSATSSIQEEIEGHPALVSILADIVRQAFKIEVMVYHHKYRLTQVFVGRGEDHHAEGP